MRIDERIQNIRIFISPSYPQLLEIKIKRLYMWHIAFDSTNITMNKTYLSWLENRAPGMGVPQQGFTTNQKVGCNLFRQNLFAGEIEYVPQS